MEQTIGLKAQYLKYDSNIKSDTRFMAAYKSYAYELYFETPN